MSDLQETRVVHVRDNLPGAVYIGRAMPRQRLKASPFANPHKIGASHPKFEGEGQGGVLARYDAVRLYSWDLFAGDKTAMFADLPELRGKPLACWCRHDGEERTPDNECHGDVLVALLETYTDLELRAMAKEANHAD